MEYDDNDDVDQNDHYTYGNDINEGLPYLAILFFLSFYIDDNDDDDDGDCQVFFDDDVNFSCKKGPSIFFQLRKTLPSIIVGTTGFRKKKQIYPRIIVGTTDIRKNFTQHHSWHNRFKICDPKIWPWLKLYIQSNDFDHQDPSDSHIVV